MLLNVAELFSVTITIPQSFYTAIELILMADGFFYHQGFSRITLTRFGVSTFDIADFGICSLDDSNLRAGADMPTLGRKNSISWRS